MNKTVGLIALSCLVAFALCFALWVIFPSRPQAESLSQQNTPVFDYRPALLQCYEKREEERRIEEQNRQSIPVSMRRTPQQTVHVIVCE